MTLPQNKIVVQDITEKIDNPRQKMYNQRIKRKPFIFKGYTTELDRIKDTIKNNRYLYNLPEKEEKSNKSISQSTEKLILNPQINNMTYSQKYELSKSIPTTKRIVEDMNLNPELIDYLIKNDIIIQPQMRFKARTDLERVYEALSGNMYRDNEREILNRQLKSLDLFNYKKPEDFIKLTNFNSDNDKSVDEEEKKSYTIKPNPIIEEEKKKENSDKKKIYKNPKYYYVPLNNERWRKRTDLNIEAYGMLKEYHKKTHFKATEEIAENKIKTRKIIKTDINIPLINSNKKINRKNLIFDFEDNDEKNKLTEKTYLPYKMNYNPMTKNEKKEHINSASMQLLTNIAFKSNDDTVIDKNDDKNKVMNVRHIKNKSNLVDENNVLIGNEILYKATQFDLIANRVLKLCNVYQKKNRHNNGSLKKGNGKMMFTQGLTINEFEKKYDFNG